MASFFDRSTMAYYDDDDDGYILPQEHTMYDLVDYQDSVSFSGYESYDAYLVSESNEPKFVDQYRRPDDYDYNYDHSYSFASHEINYFGYSYAEPKLIEYKLVECDTGYVSYHTQHLISKSEINSGFNEPEFEEYDPTPYGGGYDIVSVYGKPLPPSDQTCYPRSGQNPIEPRPRPILKSIPKLEPESEPIPIPIPIPLVEPRPEPEHEPKSKPGSRHVSFQMPPSEPVPIPTRPVSLSELVPEPKPKPDYGYPGYGYDYPWPEYDHGYEIGVGYDYGYGKQVVQVPPSEYDPEVVDLCENIFGNWPCLARIRKQQMGMDNNPRITCPENGHHNPWEDCANYFFGGPITSYNHQ